MSAIGRRLLGLGFVVLLVAMLGLAVLQYNKAFTPVVWVTLRANHTGMQLNDGAEVKMRGVVVGDVRSITANGTNATLRLALDPAAVPQIPSNVMARLLPKTLFGERFVSLVPPPDASPRPIRAGAVIGQDRTQTAIELERVLDDALPLLQAVQPDKLAATLGALAYGLEGRGDKLGANLSTLDTYLAALNQSMPAIADDVRKLATVLDVYDGALPDLLDILRNVTVTARTVTNQKDQLAAFLADSTDAADITRSFLDRYGDRIIQLGHVSAPVLELLAVYAPEYPCLLAGVVKLQPQAEQVFSGGRMHITLEATRDNGKYLAGHDEPVYGAKNGPNCRGLTDPPVPAQPVQVNDGYDYGLARPPITLPLQLPGAPAAAGSTAQTPLPVTLPLTAPMGFAGTAEERDLVKSLLAGSTGTPAAQVPDVAVLLWGPLLRGTVVNAS
jgi:phospholipid/cholesterol/gamma-HCH transport system substrate-binding protein